MSTYVVWCDIINMGEVQANSSQEAIALIVAECGGDEIEYDAMCLD